MVSTWKKDDSVLVLTQRHLPGWAFSLIGIFGTLFFIIGLVGFSAELYDLSRDTLLRLSVFTTTLLIFQFLLTLGLAMMSLRFSPRSLRNYYETIVFDSTGETITLSSPETGDAPHVFRYADTAYLLLDLRTGGTEDPDMYNVYAIKKDGAVFWVTGFSNDNKGASEFLDALHTHTGLAVTDQTGLGLDRDAVRTFTDTTDIRSACAAKYVRHASASRGDIFTLRRSALSIPHLLLGIILYGFFFSVPFYILNNFINTQVPDYARFMGWVFIVLWTGILLGTMLLSMKEYLIIASGESLTIEVRSRMFPLAKGSIRIPADRITGIRTNRIEDGACSLTLAVDAAFVASRTGLASVMNLSVYKKKPGSVRSEASIKELDLWVLPSPTMKNAGPGLCDLMFMEERLKKILTIK